LLGDGPTLLLVPGLSGIGGFWVHQIADFARHFRVITYDHRGTGRSSRPRRGYSIDQMAEDLLRLMDALKIDATILVGHSMGGAIGQTIAQDQPERIGRLVLSATWAGKDSYFRRIFDFRKELLRIGGMPSYRRLSVLMQYPPAWIDAHAAWLDAEEAMAVAEPADLEILQARIDAILSFDRRMRLGEIRAATLVVVARDDLITPPYLSEELAAGIPYAKLAMLPRGGHFAPITEPAEYNRILRQFLNAER